MTTNNPTPQPAGDAERLRLVKSLAYEFVRFNHDTRKAYLVTNVTDDCMLELEGMAGQFSPDLFQRVNDIPEHVTMELVEPVAQPAGEGEAPELLPCPFACRVSKLSIYQLPDSLSRHVYCLTCNASGPWGDSDEEAYRAWNTRTSQPATPQHVETLCACRTFDVGIAGAFLFDGFLHTTARCPTERFDPLATLTDVAERHGQPFKELLAEQMRDPEFAAEYRKVSAELDAELVAERARRAAQKWMNTHHASFETNQKREEALAQIIAAEFGSQPDQ